MIKALWNDQIPEKDGVKSPINDICISPDGSRVVVAVGNRVLLYRADNGDLIESLRGHKETVYSVSFSHDSTRFASGGADNIVVIWKITGQGLLKYNHTAPIQRVKYNPCVLLLASCSEVDFGLWTPDQKQVTKEKVTARILSASWSPDGMLLALGMVNGVISLRNQQAQELQRIERKAPVWCLQFIPDTGYGAGGGPLKATSLLSIQQQQGQGGTPNAGQASGATSTAGTETSDLLAVGCWDKTYSLYRVQGITNKLQTVKPLDYYPLSMAYSSNASSKTSYLVMSGSNKKLTLYNKEGARLSELTSKESWVWCCDCSGEMDTAALGTHHGAIDLLKMDMGTVHAVFRDRYAYRENLTEVIVHHLVTDKKVRIKCKDLIQNLSLYRNKLAVQLSDRVCVYESSADNSEDMHFRIRPEKIMIKDCSAEGNLLVITSQHLIFSRGRAVELYSFDGLRQKVWILDSVVNYMKVDGGLESQEGVLLGLQSGVVSKLFVDNPFPLELTKRPNAVKQLDINIYRTTLAIVDVSGTLAVTDLQTQEVLFTTTGVASACFNSEVEDLICITNTDTSISVINGINSAASRSQIIAESSDPAATLQSSTPEIQEQHIFGMALGFRGQKIFCLLRNSVVGVDVPQGLNMQRALEHGDIKTAYKIACLGATEADWKLLAMRALRANSLSIAKNSFARLKETKYLSLIDSIERRTTTITPQSTSSSTVAALGLKSSSLVRDRSGNAAAAAVAAAASVAALSTPTTVPPLESTWLAELMAYEGHHQEAAKIYARNGRLDEAIRLFTDLRRWEDAKMFARNAGQADVSALTLQQAKWLQEINDWKGASEMYMAMGQFLQAAKIIAEGLEPGWQDAMIEVVRACPGDSLDALEFCGDKFSNANETQLAKETYTKSKDISRLMALYAKKHMWNEAAKLADENEGKFDVSIFLSYAEWLVSQDRYEDAMQAYKKAKRLDLARRVLEELTNNAVAECRFKDAAYYYYLLSRETEVEVEGAPGAGEAKASTDNQAGSGGRSRIAVQLQSEYEHKADLYYAYASIHSYVTDPFTSLQPEMLFQVARFIINSLGNAETIPFGVSKASTMYTLARQAMVLGAYKLARHAYDRLSKLQVPERKLDEVEIDMLLVQAKPMRDDPDHLPVCYRCGSANPLLNPFSNRFAKGDVCTNCGHPFVRSFINFDVLPLVEFVPDPSISDEEAIDMIRQPPGSAGQGISSSGGTTGRAAADDKKGGKSAKEAKGDRGGGWKESKTGNAEVLSFGGAGRGSDEDDEIMEDAVNEALGVNSNESDLFTRCLNLTLERQKTTYTPVKVDANTLFAIKRSEVFVCRPNPSSKNRRATFYKNMLPEIPIAISQPCHRFFHLEDFEFAYLSEKRCPYSRLKNVGEYGSL